MKPIIVTGGALVLFGLGVGAAVAQTATCPSGLVGAQVLGAALVSTLNGNYVCAKRAAPSNDTWNEFHRGTGPGPFPIIDYKRGPNHPIDPSKAVGTYVVNVGASTVTYNYSDPGGPYTYVVTRTPNPSPAAPGYLFCNVATGEKIPAVISASPTQPFCASPP